MKLHTLAHSSPMRYSSRFKAEPDFQLYGSHERVGRPQASYCSEYQRAEQRAMGERS